jgi:ribosomal protein L11 methyltransferase
MIEIDAHLAFGTGTHETTRMICATLLGTPLKGKRVLDCGCGTGILGICALKLGAAQCTAYDIDEWSVDNTRHNSIINQVDSLLTVMHGDASLLDSQQVSFDLVMANINRNILLQDMSRFVSVMAPGSTLLLSGFYEEDCEMLTHAAQACGLTLKGKKQDDAWAMLIFTRP